MGSNSTAFKELFKKKLDEFKHLVTANWQWEISSNAEKTRKHAHMTKENVLPLEDDIKATMEMINKLEVKYARKLKLDCNVINYESLCTVTIAHIIMLDRKHAGDVAEAELTFYINRKSEEIPENMLNTLTPAQRQTIHTLDVFQIPGKRTRSVPILLTKTMRENIDLIIACRDDLKITSSNPLLFARPLTKEPFDGGKCLDKIKKLCNLKRPEMLTSTGMRHHIATMSQIHAKQNDQYTEHLAGFLGHDVAVHAKNYRLPNGNQVLQKAVVGSQLISYETQENIPSTATINTEGKLVGPGKEISEERNEENLEILKENDKEEYYPFLEEDPNVSNSKAIIKEGYIKEIVKDYDLKDMEIEDKLTENTEEGKLDEDKNEGTLNIECDKESGNTNKYNANELNDIQVEMNMGQDKPEKTSLDNGNCSTQNIFKTSEKQTRAQRGLFQAQITKAVMSSVGTEDKVIIDIKTKSHRGKFTAKPIKSKDICLSSAESEETINMKTKTRRGQFKAKAIKEKVNSSNSTKSDFYDEEDKDQRPTNIKAKNSKRKNINKTKTKRIKVYSSFSSEDEDHSDRSCEVKIQKKTKKRPIEESHSEDETPVCRRKKRTDFGPKRK